MNEIGFWLLVAAFGFAGGCSAVVVIWLVGGERRDHDARITRPKEGDK